MSEFKEYSDIDINATGNPREISTKTGDGGRTGEGPVGNQRPTGIVAEGEEVSARAMHSGGIRSGMSSEKQRPLRSVSRGRR
jgi:hypothetical protein